ncbi:hypothetical protein [Ktedonobacter racemifer]|uniref:hypothetical protein n=1 Tax=Ktedonobacter racemifer TaxID=363277 RepID=UPI0012FC3459|nr:hypothetical protein [Ktedonobacter racemifer]
MRRAKPENSQKLESRMLRKRACPVRWGAEGKGLPQGNTSPAAYPTPSSPHPFSML